MNTPSRAFFVRSSLGGVLSSLGVLLLAAACGSEGDVNQGGLVREPLNPSPPGQNPAPGDPSGGDLGGGAGGGGPVGGNPDAPANPDDGITVPIDTPQGPVVECASASQPTELQGVTLVFGFDVSYSMASSDEVRQLKWEPVVLAARTFFSSPSSKDVSAQLTFFPSERATTVNTGPTTPAAPLPPADDDEGTGGAAGGGGGAPGGGGGFGGFGGGGFGGGGGSNAACTQDEYTTPDIPLTALPSDLFGTTIDATQPNRVGTPTRWILPALIEQAAALKETNPANYAVVLVTDGLPTNCAAFPAEDDIDEVAALAAAGPAAGIPVYVIGVAPSEEEGDGIGNLNEIAVQGGTQSAFMVDTGDVDKTVADFLSVIETIKESTFSCNMPIPAPPPGQVFDPAKVNVAFKTDPESGEETPMVYSPDCTAEWGWHYDNEANPTTIVLCDSACGSVKSFSSTAGSVDIEFGCERRIINR
jgi:predicted regulator of Ras-like GTPase activity (Roadblock/LC7/MglB family)